MGSGMLDEFASAWLTKAERSWSGPHAALAARLSQPQAARLTEEQEAQAIGLARRVMCDHAAALPLQAAPETIWERWEADGFPAAAALAPYLLARVEEYRWRRIKTGTEPDIPPLFVQAKSPDGAITLLDDSAITQREEGEIDPAELCDAAYLQLRLADGERLDGLGQPLLASSELPAAIRRSLFLDLAAQDLALFPTTPDRAAQLAQAIDGQMTIGPQSPVDAAARAYCQAMEAASLRSEAASAAIARHDWLALIALLAGRFNHSFLRTAGALIASSDQQLIEVAADIGVSAAQVVPLLDSLAALPGRLPCAEPDSAEGNDTVSALTARAVQRGGVQP
jgi:hypothetical protein